MSSSDRPRSTLSFSDLVFSRVWRLPQQDFQTTMTLDKYPWSTSHESFSRKMTWDLVGREEST